MHNAWIIAFGATLLFAAGCADMSGPEEPQVSTSASTQGVDSDSVADSDSSDSDSDSASDLGYGWTQKIIANKENGFTQDFSISDIVTNPTVIVRKDNTACVACHSWAAYSDRRSFCDRVDDFLAMPTSKGDGTDPASAKPANLKSIFKKWKSAGCPD